MRRDYLFHELYSDNHGLTKPCWIMYVAQSNREPIFLQFQDMLLATAARI
jgi:hypothetical protein